MIKKIKDILGIEGVKIKLELNEDDYTENNIIQGRIIFNSQSEKHIERIIVKLIEKYKRGRKESALINDYLLGSIELDVDISIGQNEQKAVKFDLPFNLMKSEMDLMEEKSFLSRPFFMLAKKLKNVSSTYRVEATAIISGTKFHPITEQQIEF